MDNLIEGFIEDLSVETDITITEEKLQRIPEVREIVSQLVEDLSKVTLITVGLSYELDEEAEGYKEQMEKLLQDKREPILVEAGVALEGILKHKGLM